MPIKLLKLGIDPTAPELHLGHAVALRYAHKMQALGDYKLCLVFGTFTAQIGDPTGNNKERPVLSLAEVKENASLFMSQVGHLIDTTPGKFQLYYNHEWLESITMKQIIRHVGQVTVAQMLERADFKKRYLENESINMREFMYPILQALDSVHLYIAHGGTTGEVEQLIELGGIDQTFNVHMGSQIMERSGYTPQDVAFVDLLPGTDGKQKMSKSKGNFIPLKGDAYSIFTQLMRIPDELCKTYSKLLRVRFETSNGTSIRDSKESMSLQILGEICGFSPAEIDDAIARYIKVKNGEFDLENLETFSTIPADASLAHFMKRVGMVASVSEGNRFITAKNTVKMDGAHVKAVVEPGEYTLSIGKKRHYKVTVVQSLRAAKSENL